MFDNFTFGAASTQPYEYDDTQPSPTDDSFPHTEPTAQSTESHQTFEDYEPTSPITDIVYQFNQSSFFNDNDGHVSTRSYRSPTPSLSEGSEASSPTSTTRSVPTTPLLSPSRGGSLACRRLQRQLNVQLQSSGAHIRDINILVEDMLKSNSQCCLRKPTSKSSLITSPISTRLEVDPIASVDVHATEMGIENVKRNWMDTVIRNNDIDEGYVEGDGWDSEDVGTSLRRASTPMGIRKHGLRCRTSSEVLHSRVKIAKTPRMKTRRHARVAY